MLLEQAGRFHATPKPSLVVLDWNMPKRTGAELLQLFKKSERLRAVPVVIHSTSADQAEVQFAYSLGASCWVQKADELDTVIQRWCSIVLFWSRVAALPREMDNVTT